PDSDVFSPGSCRKSFADLVKECYPAPPGSGPDPCGLANGPGAVATSGTVCAEVCEIYADYQEISGRQGSPTGGAVESAGLLAPPEISLEGLDSIRANSASAPDPKAKDVSVTGPSAAVATAAARGKVVPASVPAGKVLSEKEKVAALPPEEQKWLTEFIAPIILPEEKKVYLELAEPYQRELFKNDFWERRERQDLQPPLGPGYRYRYEELRRLADDVYDGWRQDAGRMVLRFGEPASIEKAKDCGETFRDLEIWTYARGQLPQGSRYFFYRPTMGAP